jgi:hypothetical protein
MAHATNSENETRPPSTGFSGPMKLAAFGVAALALLAAIWLLTRTDRPFEISLDKEGKVTIEARSGDSFAMILDSMLGKDLGSVEGALNARGFYRLSSPQLVDALARIDTAAPPNAGVTQGMRELLWNLAGPFKRPGTFAGADERLIGALEELETHPTSKLFAGIWERSLERTSIFRPRSFGADVMRLSGGPAAPPGEVFVYACPGNELVGKRMTLWTEGAPSGALTGLIVDDLQRFDCGNAGKAVEELLAGQPAQLALDRASFAVLFGDSDPAMVPRSVAAKFRVHPKELTAAVVSAAAPALAASLTTAANTRSVSVSDCSYNGRTLPERAVVGGLVCRGGQWRGE